MSANRRVTSFLASLACLLSLTFPARSGSPDWLAQWRTRNSVWRGVHVMLHDDPQAEALVEELPQLEALGVNVLVLEVDYGFQFASHPELSSQPALSRAAAASLAKACRTHGIRPIPLFNCLGHQSWSKTTLPLLAKYPQFDETPGQFPENEGIYCRSWCPQHPDVNKIVHELLDELIDAFAADAIHVGMDEVFLIGSTHCPRCRDGDPAKLFALAVNALHDHVVKQRKLEMLIWSDRLLDGKATGLGEWEAATNNTHGAIGLIPKDIILCDWHYEPLSAYPGKPADYVSIGHFLEQGFRVWPSSWRNAEAARALAESAQRQANERVLGQLCTTWGAVPIPSLAEWPPLLSIIESWSQRGK